jgi:hypothetical protein
MGEPHAGVKVLQGLHGGERSLGIIFVGFQVFEVAQTLRVGHFRTGFGTVGVLQVFGHRSLKGLVYAFSEQSQHLP